MGGAVLPVSVVGWCCVFQKEPDWNEIREGYPV